MELVVNCKKMIATNSLDAWEKLIRKFPEKFSQLHKDLPKRPA